MSQDEFFSLKKLRNADVVLVWTLAAAVGFLGLLAMAAFG